MKKPILTIIMPVYNTEGYLKKSIESVINQNFKDFELIIINDGSTDGSLEILKKFQNYDKRIIVINIDNSGVSNARNIGLSYARGKYITFVDSDDYIDKNIYVECLREFDNSEIDIITFNYYYEFENRIDIIPSKNEIKILDKKSFYQGLLSEDKYKGFIWNKIYKRELIDFDFDSDVHMCEDLLFNVKYMKKIHKAKFIDKKYYHYVQHNGSSINTGINIKSTTVVDAYFRIKTICKEEGFDFDLNTKKTLLMHALKNIIIYKKYNVDNQKKIDDCNIIIKKYYYTILFSKVDIISKIKIFLLRRFKVIYLVFKEKKRIK